MIKEVGSCAEDGGFAGNETVNLKGNGMNKRTKNRLKKIQAVVFDVDGVLTDGGIIIGSDGTEYKKFNVKDGSGISMLRHSGIKTGIISGRYSKTIEIRAKELKIDAVYQDVILKAGAYQKLKKRFGLNDEEICFMGDDVIDLQVFGLCGFSFAPSDAVSAVKKRADYVCAMPGGCGCVREACEMVLEAKGILKEASERYLKHEKGIKKV